MSEIWVFLAAAAVGVIVLIRGFLRARPAVGGWVAAPTDQPIWLDGNGRFNTDIVGESFHQAAIGALCGGKCEAGHHFELNVDLVLDDANPHDHMAVAVTAGGQLIGHLSRPMARTYRARLAAIGLGHRAASCRAKIVGGWRRTRRGVLDEGDFGVKLDIA